MQFSPFISVDRLSSGPSSGKAARTTGLNSLFAAHLVNAAREQTDLTPLDSTKSTAEALMSLFAAPPVKENEILEESLRLSLFDNSSYPADQISFADEGMSAFAPALLFNDTHSSAKNNDAALKAIRDIPGATEPDKDLHGVLKDSLLATSKNSFVRGEATEAEPQPAVFHRQTAAVAGETDKGLAQPFQNQSTGFNPLSQAKDALITEANRSGPRSDRGEGTPLAVLDNRGNEHRSEQSMHRDNGQGAQFKDTANENVVSRDNGGRTITIRQFSHTEETLPPPVVGTRPAVEAHSAPQDTRAHYIHSSLPYKANRSDGENKIGQQQESPSHHQKESDPARPIQSQGQSDIRSASLPLAGTSEDSEPLLFANNPITTPPPTTTGTQTELGMLRLPSGLMVPGGTVVDQLIAHFSANRRLESGSISLQLHPRELGALRMEIKVEQDNIKAHITVQNPQAQEMIDRHLPRLREALEQQGLHLQQIEVTIAADDNTNGRRFQDNHPQQRQAGRFQRGSFTPSTTALETEGTSGHAPGTMGKISIHA